MAVGWYRRQEKRCARWVESRWVDESKSDVRRRLLVHSAKAGRVMCRTGGKCHASWVLPKFNIELRSVLNVIFLPHKGQHAIHLAFHLSCERDQPVVSYFLLAARYIEESSISLQTLNNAILEIKKPAIIRSMDMDCTIERNVAKVEAHPEDHAVARDPPGTTASSHERFR